MLDGTGDAGRDVELRRDDLAGLPHLPVVGGIAGVHGGARGAQGCIQFVGERFQHLMELFGTAQSAASGHDHRGSRQFRPLVAGTLAAHEGGLRAIDRHGGLLHDGGRTPVGRRLVERGATHRQYLHRVGALHGGNGIAGVDGAAEGIGGIDAGHVRNLRHIEQRRHARHEVATMRRGCRHHVAVAGGLGHHLGSHRFGQLMGQRRIVHHLHLAHARHLCRGLGHDIHAATQHQQVHVAAQPAGGAHRLPRGTFQIPVVMFGNYQYCHGSLLVPLRLAVR